MIITYFSLKSHSWSDNQLNMSQEKQFYFLAILEILTTAAAPNRRTFFSAVYHFSSLCEIFRV